MNDEYLDLIESILPQIKGELTDRYQRSKPTKSVIEAVIDATASAIYSKLPFRPNDVF